MRPSHRRWTARRPGVAGILAVATVTAGLGFAPPAGAVLPNGAISKVSSEGGSSRAVIDDSGATIAYIQGDAGHVMVGVDRIVPNAGADEIAISGDGSTVAFSTDNSLVGEDGNGVRDVYAVSRSGGGLRLVSTGQPGVGAFSPSLNGNGSSIAYSAGPLAAGQARRIFVRDGGGGPIEVGLPPGEQCDCVHPSMSNDGNAVAFEITDSGVFVWSRGGATERIANKGASRPSMSGNGAAVAFAYQSAVNVYRRDSRSMTTVPVEGSSPDLSADGNIVAFQASRQLAGDSFGLAGDHNGAHDVVAYELGSGRTLAVSRAGAVTGRSGSYQPSVNANGSSVVFESDAENLVADGNNQRDIFLRIPSEGGGLAPGAGGELPADVDPDIPGAYWLVASDGGVFSFAGLGVDPRFFGSTGDIALNQPIVGAAPHPSGQGYWFVASDGGVFNFGASGFHGSTGAITLNQPIVGMAATPSGAGYWLVARDGGIFAFGDAAFMGSTGDITLNQPIVGMAARPQGDGYWMVASDGGVFAFGQAPFKGSTGAITLNQPIVGIAATRTGTGYWFVASDGGVFNFGDAGFFGSTGAIKLNKPIVGIAGSS